MNTLELINTLIDTIIENKMVAEIIKDQIAIHSKSDPIIILQKDVAGNEYSPAVDAVAAHYLPDTSYRGKVLNDDELEDTETTPELYDVNSHDPSSINDCIVLWPTN